MERNIHPESLSPSLSAVAVLSVLLKKIAIRLFSPIIVPTRVNGGVSGAGGCAAMVGVGAGAAATVGVRGRRDAEKSGRSRVAESFEMGMAHKGFPVVQSSGAGCPASVDATPFASGPALSVSIAASENTEDRGWAKPATWHAKTATPAMASAVRLTGTLATVRTPRQERALVCLPLRQRPVEPVSQDSQRKDTACRLRDRRAAVAKRPDRFPDFQ